jgi:hypothetical protein
MPTALPTSAAVPAFAGAQATFTDLPDDMWIEIFSRLPGPDVSAALSICHRASHLAKDVWRALCLQHWEPLLAEVHMPAGLTWRQCSVFCSQKTG